MLVLSFRLEEGLRLSGMYVLLNGESVPAEVTIKVTEIHRGNIRLGIEAPREIGINRLKAAGAKRGER